MKDIQGYEGLYAITSCGRVWSYKSKKILKPQLHNCGYLKVRLYKNGQGKNFYIHRLVAEAYLSNLDGLSEVNHLDENKSHNWINNLEWCDRKANCNYGTRTERAAVVCSKPVYCVELDRVFKSQSEAATALNVSAAGISFCCNGKRETHCGYHWRYYNVG